MLHAKVRKASAGLPPEEWSSLRYGSREPKEDGSMSRKRHRPDEIVAKLRQVEVLTAQGRPVAEAIRSMGVTQVSSGTSCSTARSQMREVLQKM